MSDIENMPEPLTPAPMNGSAALAIQAALIPQINFACQQNAVAVIKQLALQNNSAQSYTQLQLEMGANPAFIAPKRWLIERLEPGQVLQLGERDTRLNGEFLMNLEERLLGGLSFRLSNTEGECLAEWQQDLEVLARNEWSGYGDNPELLAAFATPNSRALQNLLRQVAELLRKHDGNGRFHTYADGEPKRLWLQAAALWNILAALKLEYAYPPASFERSGQKIRSVDAILEHRLATCLDSTMLVASLLEQMGLHPLVVLESGHAYVGVWLKDDAFAQAFSRDGEALRKRVALKEILVWETTLLCQRDEQGKPISFKQAVKVAQDKLLAGASAVVGIVDITRARADRIRPLAFMQKAQFESPSGEEQQLAPLDTPNGEDLESAINPALLTAKAQTSSGRLAQWQRKLLDLSLRNPLLNMRASKTNIPLLAPNPGLIEDLLAQGKALSLESQPGWGARDAELHLERTGEQLDQELALAALARHRLYAPLEPAKLESALVELYRKARNDLEEGGANTLFLAIGMLYWRKAAADERAYRAPLVLIPVSISRQSVRSGIKISLSDDEPRFNTTLLEMLRQDFQLDIPGLDGPLPTDEAGTDIPGILAHLRHQLRDVPGFEVQDQVFLGTFSFAKYLMWKDLVDRTAQLKDNPVVRHLIDTPRELFAAQQDFIAPVQLDSELNPAEVFTPLSADSSQLAAVIAAARGKNFVMIGPPGTGKSQTIANMIAHNLGLGRRVLFVAEKAAALDVVYRRLRAQGLGDFCLELHSNKARKLDVLRQLGQAWDSRGELAAGTWEADTGQLRKLRDQLNAQVRVLHQRHSNGLSVRQALAVAAGYPDTLKLPLSWGDTEHSASEYQALLETAERLDINLAALTNLPLNQLPLALIHQGDWSLAWQQQLLTQARALSLASADLQARLAPLAAQLSLVQTAQTPAFLAALAQLCQSLVAMAGRDMSFAFAPNVAELLAQLEAALGEREQFDAGLGQLSCSYKREQLLAGDWSAAQQQWQLAQTRHPLLAWFNAWRCKRLLRLSLGALGAPDPERDLPLLARLRELAASLHQRQPLLEKVSGWRGLDSPLEVTRQLYQLARDMRASLAPLADNPEALLQLRSWLRNLVLDANELLAPEASVGRQLGLFTQAYQQLLDQAQGFAPLAGQAPPALLDAAGDLPALVSLADQLEAQQARLNSWCAWRRVRDQACSLGLQPLVAALESGPQGGASARHLLEVNYARWWLTRTVDASPELRRFVAREQEQKSRDFCRLDAQVRALTADFVRARVRLGLVEKEAAKRSSEFGIIRRELEKKTRHKPLRQLISEAPSAIASLTPCLLMSPLSIAQYLPVEQEPFDLVIFDEASQITLWDAVGALARGKQCVVAGDPKQLPPTSFFGTGQNAELEDEEEMDLESVLDELLGANLPSVKLAWHYRSRHESLISFSNHSYYQGELVSFPAPVTRDEAVRLVAVNGVYERGGNQTNRIEAEAIVAEIQGRLGDPEKAKQTLGVVTFNQKQQTLILDLLELARAANPELDKAFAEDLIEPVFVKNLESVQGDERDVILFSTTFGPDAEGGLTMNFGPLNKTGGERRLNVAITRARQELLVFSSLKAEQIDLRRTQALGVRDLKRFLEFAERGIGVLGEGLQKTSGDFASPLERCLAQDLAAKGWQVHPQVGVSRFRVELAVVDPRAPDRYLAGIECDGASYQNSATARDRELVREAALRGLGWQLLRFWSRDYWLDRQGVVDKLDAELRQLLE